MNEQQFENCTVHNDDEPADFDPSQPWADYGWVESPDGYFEGRDPVEGSGFVLTLWNLSSNEAVKIRALFDADKRVDWREDDGALKIYGLPEGSHRLLKRWSDARERRWLKKREEWLKRHNSWRQRRMEYIKQNIIDFIRFLHECSGLKSLVEAAKRHDR
jgi:hypothetical protein